MKSLNIISWKFKILWEYFYLKNCEQKHGALTGYTSYGPSTRTTQTLGNANGIGSGEICDDCDTSCAECEGDSRTCTNCDNGLYLYESKCVDNCADKQLIYMNSCVFECPSNTFLNGRECVISSPNGKFGDKNICSNCDVSCASCKNSSTLCTNCFEGNFLIWNQCLNSCPNGTFTFQGYCVSECPSGSYLYENNCQIEIEYYNVNDKIVKQPRIPKKNAILGLAILAIVFIGEIIAIIFISHWLCCN